MRLEEVFTLYDAYIKLPFQVSNRILDGVAEPTHLTERLKLETNNLVGSFEFTENNGRDGEDLPYASSSLVQTEIEPTLKYYLTSFDKTKIVTQPLDVIAKLRLSMHYGWLRAQDTSILTALKAANLYTAASTSVMAYEEKNFLDLSDPTTGSVLKLEHIRMMQAELYARSMYNMGIPIWICDSSFMASLAKIDEAVSKEFVTEKENMMVRQPGPGLHRKIYGGFEWRVVPGYSYGSSNQSALGSTSTVNVSYIVVPNVLAEVDTANNSPTVEHADQFDRDRVALKARAHVGAGVTRPYTTNSDKAILGIFKIMLKDH